MLDNLEATIHEIIQSASADMAKAIATAVRKALAAEIMGTAVAAPAKTKRGPGRPRKTAKPTASAQAKLPKASRLKRRSSKRVAKDDAAVLDAIKARPGMRALDLKKAIKMPSQNIASGLKRLREAGKIKMKGNKSAAVYSAA